MVVDQQGAGLKSEYGGEWLRPDGGEPSRMPRTPVGLANHPATNFNWQLSVAHGCLISGPSCLILPVGWVRASNSRLAEPVVRAGKVRSLRNSRVKSLSFGA
jgi:hypothetical protein